MQIIESNKDQLNEFVLKNSGSFQQSWQWGELQERMGREVKRYLFLENGEPRLAGSFVRHGLPMGKYYWLCPKGPVFGLQIADFRLQILEEMREKLGGIFIRIEPEIFSKSEISNLKSKMAKAPKDHNPRATIWIDLGKTEEQLLAEMHSKTRYNLRLAERKGIRISNLESRIEDFISLMEKTAKRDKFRLHPRKYYEELSKVEEVKLFGAYHEAKLIAGAMVSFWGERATYLHGASDYDLRNLMAPYLLHWEIIRQAKRAGLKYYDLGGVAPSFAKASAGTAHPLLGITRFKKGFGGEYVEYVGSLDYVLSPLWYSIYKIARKVL